MSDRLFLYYSGTRLVPVKASEYSILIDPTGTITFGGIQNDASGLYNSILGGNNNIINIINHYSFIGAGSGNRLHCTESSAILGGLNNILTGVESLSTGSIIAGGERNFISGLCSYIGAGKNNKIFSSGKLDPQRVGQFVVAQGVGIGGSSINGGEDNIISGYNAHIGGGCNNKIPIRPFPELPPITINTNSAILGGSGNIALSFQTNVIGGANNKAGYCYASVIGGTGNYAQGCQATIQGGVNNRSDSPTSSIVGGRCNWISGGAFGNNNNFIGGGNCNVMILSQNSNINGGEKNYMYDSDTSNIFGGCNNSIGNFYSNILGGRNNIANGYSTTIVGGIRNSTINLSGSLLLGSNINSTKKSSMVLADGSNRQKNALADNALTVNFCRGIYIKGKESPINFNLTGFMV